MQRPCDTCLTKDCMLESDFCDEYLQYIKTFTAKICDDIERETAYKRL